MLSGCPVKDAGLGAKLNFPFVDILEGELGWLKLNFPFVELLKGEFGNLELIKGNIGFSVSLSKVSKSYDLLGILPCCGKTLYSIE